MGEITVGPWKAVVDADDPDSASKDTLYDAVNMYPPDTGRASAYMARPGVALVNSGAALPAKVRAIHRHVLSDGTTSAQYLVSNGKLYKIANTLSTSYSVTDVTPSNVSINPASNVFLESFADSVIVNDQFHPPWAFDPVANTGAYIQYDAAPATLLTIGTIDKTVRIATTTVPLGELTRLGYSATDNNLPAGTVPANTWAGYRVTMNVLGGVVTAAAANYTTGYASEAAAIAAIPAPANNEWDVGYFTVQAQAGSAWIAGTHSLATGATTPALTTNYYAQQAASWFARGRPTVYGAKLFFILHSDNSDRIGTSITWSEEADHTVGYHQSGYDNVWDLIQTGEDALTAIRGTEAGLYCARVRSILRITGVVDETFRTNSTTDDIQTTGVAVNGVFEQVEQTLWFHDAEWRPRMMPVGGSVKDIYEDMRRTANSAYATALTSNFLLSPTHRPQPIYWPSTHLVLFLCWDGVTLFAFDVKSQRYVGRMLLGISTGVFLDALGVLYDSDRTPLLYVSGALDSGSALDRKSVV